MTDDDHSALTSPTVVAAGLDRDRDRRAPRFSWTSAYERTFFESLCESLKLGLRDSNTFKSEAWARAMTALRDYHNVFATKSHLINKADNARKRFRLWRGLREDPRFIYDPVARTVTADDEAWKSHIDNEPLSRALRGRPFDHEELMEILYPDVVGSGGAPKRVLKTRRKGADDLSPDEADDASDNLVITVHQTPQQPSFSSPAQPVSARVHQSTGGHARPASTAIPPRSNMGSVSALTPPEETAIQNRKRGLSISNVVDGKPTAAVAQTAATATTATATTATALAATPLKLSSTTTDKRRKTANYTTAIMLPDMGNGVSVAGSGAASSDSDADQEVSEKQQMREQLHEQRAMLDQVLDLLKARPRWSEQAMDIFIRDFHKEDLDLQIKIAEKVLTDENKAMLFCKLPENLRSHWVMRLREMHNNNRSNQ